MAAPTTRRRDVLRFRLRRHQLDRGPGTANGRSDAALLDYGVQDTGPDGAAWALALRGAVTAGAGDLALAWTLRGAPHAYRRSDLRGVAVATALLSEVDAAKRVFDASKPLKATGIPVLDALRVVAGHTHRRRAPPAVRTPGRRGGPSLRRHPQPPALLLHHPPPGRGRVPRRAGE
ncbi:MAG: hypothetical protein M3N11_01545 [Actinomycetota bacterium]|nr:hypothetical protein [Actinomycetota bacterium]